MSSRSVIATVLLVVLVLVVMAIRTVTDVDSVIDEDSRRVRRKVVMPARDTDTTEIPRSVHYIWLQGEAHCRAHSPINARSLQSWKDFCKSYDLEFCFWDEGALCEEIWPAVPDWVPLLYDQLKTAAGKADVARAAILWACGGWYADADFEVVRPSLMHWTMSTQAPCAVTLYTGPIAPTWLVRIATDHFYNNAFYGCVPGHPLPARILEEAFARLVVSRSPQQSLHVEVLRLATGADTLETTRTTSPMIFTRIVDGLRRAGHPIHVLSAAATEGSSMIRYYAPGQATPPYCAGHHHTRGSWLPSSVRGLANMDSHWQGTTMWPLLAVGSIGALLAHNIFT